MGWFSDTWDSFTGFVDDALHDTDDTLFQPLGRATEDAVTDTGRFFSKFGEVLVNGLWRPILGHDVVDADNLDDWDADTMAALMSVVPGPWQPFAMAYSLGSGAYDMSQNGITLENTLQVAPSALGAFKGVGAANAAGTSKLAGAAKGAVGLPTGVSNPNSIRNASAAGDVNPYQAAAGDIQASSDFGSSIANATPTPTPSSLTSAPQLAGYSGPTSAPMSSAPQGQSLLNKFGDFASNQVESSARRQQIGTLAENIMPTPTLTGAAQGTLFPEGRTPASGYGGSGALSRFNPGVASGNSGDPISAQDYNTGIQNLTGSKQNKIASIFQSRPFRGQTPGDNSALGNQLSKTNEGYDLELGEYNREIQSENDRRGNAAIYNGLMSANDLSTEQMTEFMELAQGGDDAAIAKRVANPEEFKRLFGNLKALT